MQLSFSLVRLAAFAFAFAAAGAGTAAVTATPANAAETSLAPVLAPGDWVAARADAASVRGKVVIVDIFTFGCINCRNIVANLRSLRASASGDVAIVGVHAPETPYERVRSNVVTNLAEQGIVWPVRLDDDFAVWRAYAVDAWPTQLIFDRHGRLRKTVVGDSQDALVNTTIAALRAER
ncbi:MAG: redoxin domain-containing protein [Candidatus Eremiobacteraeota bacterium]|nr:redoxin domain-containing protein [Candidatus Eremiobacteraeota bacterium]